MRLAGVITCAVVTVALTPLSCGSNDETAIEIDVKLPSSNPPTSVLMFLASSTPMTPVPLDTGSGLALNTRIYAELEPGADVVQVADVQTPGEAVFLYQPGPDGLDTIPIAIAVGMSGGSSAAPVLVGTVSNLVVYPGKVARYSITLGSAGPPNPTTTSGPRGVELWGATVPAQGCVLVAPAGSDDSTVFTAIVRSPDDPDCDGVANLKECPGDDYTYDGTTIASDFSCAATFDFPTTSGLPDFMACALGAQQCSDRSSSDKTCGSDSAGTEPLCAYPSLCTACPSPGVAIARCVSLVPLTNLTRVACQFQFSHDLDGNVIECDPVLALPGSNNPALVDPKLEAADGTFPTDMDLLNGQTAAITGNAVTISGTPSGSGSGSGAVQALLVSSPGAVGDGTTALRGGAIPIYITSSDNGSNACASNAACTIVNGSDELGDKGYEDCLDLEPAVGSN